MLPLCTLAAALVFGQLFRRLGARFRPFGGQKSHAPLQFLAASDAQNAEISSILLPCTGRYDQPAQALKWLAILAARLPKQVMFLVESASDPALGHIFQFLVGIGLEATCEIQRCGGQNCDQNGQLLSEGENWPFPASTVQIVISGTSYDKSQKIHGLLAALPLAGGVNLVVLDDDVLVQAQLLPNLVNSLKQSDITTGYSVEYPINNRNYWSLMICAYRAINLISFSGPQPPFLWGGMFAITRAKFDEFEVEKLYQDHCYSEDMSLSFLARQRGLSIGTNSGLLASNQVADVSFMQYANYTKRQLYVLTMYTNKAHFIQNTLMLMGIALGGLFVNCILGFAVFQVCSVELLYQHYYMVIYIVCIFWVGKSVNVAISGCLAQLGQSVELGDFRMGLAMVAHLALLPVFVLQVVCTRRIQWGRSIFERRDGRVFRVFKDLSE
ncbi:Ceramide glucosyltransferase [Spironucleus salmonicida]|uniref:ceramide glucosyltransferase n=1 Tax=Spironucleus salmonicida TaxID=348837 RepID=V6LW38_9EUKA|nr:Ceramide glucosyltransferase [Spironucleus salmonicida]|eukprot:EST48842.1 Glucosyl transferase family protein [Spironucleus salmonicida]